MVEFEVERNIKGNVMHDLINATFGNYESVPHEWYFLSVLSQEEIFEDKEIADAFFMYIIQYYPHYPWHFFNKDDYLATVVCECELKAFQFKKRYQLKSDFDMYEEEYFKQAMLFGDIVTDFLIRYRNYSLIKCSGERIILTAQSDCHKRFEPQLSKGYSLQKRAKVGYIKSPEILAEMYPAIKGYFYKLPVLPTREVGYPVDEIIETANGNYEKVLQFQKVIL